MEIFSRGLPESNSRTRSTRFCEFDALDTICEPRFRGFLADCSEPGVKLLPVDLLELPEVTVISVIPSSSVSDTNDPEDFAEFASRNQDILATETRPMLSPADLVQLPKGQAFALIEGGQLYKIRMPLPDILHDPAMPENLEAIAREMERLYSGAVGFEHSQLTVEGKGSGF